MVQKKPGSKFTLILILLASALAVSLGRTAVPYLAPGWWSDLQPRWRLGWDLLAVLLLAGTALWSVLSWWAGLIFRERGKKRGSVPHAPDQVASSLEYRALEEVKDLFLEAPGEEEIVRGVLQAVRRLTGAEGVSYVPLDQGAYPGEAITTGAQPTSDLEAWVEYLASPVVRGSCASCRDKQPGEHCPLLQDPFEDELQLYCFPLRLGGHEFGVINVYGTGRPPLASATQRIVQLVADQAALYLENQHLRRREEHSLKEMAQLEPGVDLQGIITEELHYLQNLLEMDFASLTLRKSPAEPGVERVRTGILPAHLQEELRELTNQVMEAGKPALMRKGDRRQPGDPAVMAAPFQSRDRTISGVVLVGKEGGEGGFQPQQMQLLQNIVPHLAFLMHNLQMIQALKYQAMLEERNRLAREIHDGLAQTLGYLKLQIAQIRRATNSGEMDALSDLVEESYQAVAEAYRDAREAIDGLQIDPTQRSFLVWLEQVAGIFQRTSGVGEVDLELEGEGDLPPEVQIQLIRIVQEALSNVRKHADASRVEISGRLAQEGVRIIIRDNGRGFSPQGVDVLLQHGIRGMEERAQLINGSLNINSQPGSGTRVRVTWPDEDEEVGPDES